MDIIAARRRIAEFEGRFARAQATEVVELGWGHALLQRDYPASWHHNRIVVTDDVDPSAVAEAADQVLGGHGHAHRLVHFTDDGQGAAAEETFAAAGYGVHERIVTMIHSGDLPPRVDGAEEIPFDVWRPSLIHDWRTEFPNDSEDAVAQLADRTKLYPLGADVTLLGVKDGADVVARGELYTRDGVAQFENIVTRLEHRGKGYARALVAEALHRSHAAGCDLWFLIAEATDWPRGWYHRMGYREVAEAHIYQRTPDQ
ncbi:glutathione S-transferase domain protein [Alloactinosynnema sp. L-07]|uniref:GNAT family N-acetyltransferase n=1 Tax=Alloactinosynnema sp. L-07 TaxID=1653480 RepID=UPI00065EF30A|nr:GNAT family N-acetyltransferase [Alloactinosynnema sp. L-07]CRK61851.1 glutathione S-transferase domain protein [Alloactinosynnema sp. L-07]